MTTPQSPGDKRRADIKVHMGGTTWLVWGGTTWLVDVGVICPGTPRLLAMDAYRIPGRAAAA